MSRQRRFILSSLPPSLNRQNRAVNGGIIKSKDYRTWYANAEKELSYQRGYSGYDKCPDFLWRSEILFPCNMSGMDIDNAPKAIHDLIVRCNKVPDDRYLVDTRIRWVSENQVTIITRKEEFEKWAKIKKFSKPLAMKLAKNSM